MGTTHKEAREGKSGKAIPDAVSPNYHETLRSDVLNFRVEGCSHFVGTASFDGGRTALGRPKMRRFAGLCASSPKVIGRHEIKASEDSNFHSKVETEPT